MTLRQSATRLSLYLARQVDLPDERVEPLRFGLEIITGSLIKGLFIFVLAWTLNLVTEVATALFVGSTFRLLAGGAHSTGYGRCLFLGLTVYLVTGWVAATYGSILPPHGLIYLLAAGFLLCCFAVLWWAPGKVPGKRLTSPKRRQFKALSILYLALWLGGAVYLAGHGYASLALAGLLALLAQGFSLTPVGYRLIERYDSLLTRKQYGKEVTADVGRV
jgi:accessory gene regulator B